MMYILICLPMSLHFSVTHSQDFEEYALFFIRPMTHHKRNEHSVMNEVKQNKTL